MLRTDKDHRNALLYYIRYNVLNVNTLLAVEVILSQNISNNAFTLFPCNIVFFSVHIVIHKSGDSFHLYTTEII